MNFEDIRNILKTSNPRDWLYDSDDGIYTYKPDVRLNILTKFPVDPELDRKIDEDWVNKFSSKDTWMLIAKV